MKAAAFDYQRADSAVQAVQLLGAASGMAKVCGGSQSLGPMLNLRLAQTEALIDVSRIENMRAFTLQPNVLRVGGAVTHARIEDRELPDVTLGLLPHVASGIAYRAVRNRGTLGGSLAHADPAADWVATMSLLDAGIVTVGVDGDRTVPASEFFLGPFTTALQEDDVVVAVEVPRFGPGARWAYRKLCRKPGEFADAIAAGWIDPARGIARVVLGALDGMPHVVNGQAAVAALNQPAAVQNLFDEAGVDDEDARELHAVLLGRVLKDLAP
jgi:carbon-monoxide dehydrogenase medium subunit